MTVLSDMLGAVGASILVRWRDQGLGLEVWGVGLGV